MSVDGTYAGEPTSQEATLEVKLPGKEVLKPGNTVRTTDPTEEFENVGADDGRIGTEVCAALRYADVSLEAVESVGTADLNP